MVSSVRLEKITIKECTHVVSLIQDKNKAHSLPLKTWVELEHLHGS